MTIESFMSNYKIKSKKTVVSWIKLGLIPSAELKKNYIPNSARPPYTKARAKTTSAIYCSIIKASIERRHVLPQLYGLCPDEFNAYIDQLVNAGFITKRITDGITYYDATISASQYMRKNVLEVIEACSRGVAEGTANALATA